MSDRQTLLTALKPVFEFLKTVDLNQPEQVKNQLTAKFPVHGEAMKAVRQLFREGVQANWLCERENAGVRYGRVLKATAPGEWSLDSVHMNGPGVGHTHPQGEVDLCFAIDGSGKFDGQAEGWTVYAPNTWHVPTVKGGAMDILYFLPSGAIEFGPKQAGSTGVGLQA